MLQDMLEEWTGLQLEMTIYHGPRIYRKGSVLNMHADVFRTHIISAIVHVSHRNVQETWPLEVIGFDGKTKFLKTDEPGQIILYESAKVIHGRPSPLNGTEYTNIFFHYKPRGWQTPKTWTRPFKPEGWREEWDPIDGVKTEL